MKVQCPNCNAVYGDDATAQPSRRAVMVLIAVIAIAAGWAAGFFCGGILTRPNRQKVNAEIAGYKTQVADSMATADKYQNLYTLAMSKVAESKEPKLSLTLEEIVSLDILSGFSFKLLAIQSVRVRACGQSFWESGDVLETTIPVLQSLYASLRKFEPAATEDVIGVHRLLVDAVEAEHNYQRSLKELADVSPTLGNLDLTIAQGRKSLRQGVMACGSVMGVRFSGMADYGETYNRLNPDHHEYK